MRVAILASGRGSNLQALLDRAAASGSAGYQVVLVVSNQRNAAALRRARAAGISAVVVERRPGEQRSAFDARLAAVLDCADVDLVCLAGFMHILGPAFVERWRGRLVNIHPSLLPAYPGLDTHARALHDGVDRHGCTVHWVRSEVDAGPIVAQASVPVLPSDDPEALAARVLVQEHRIYPDAVSGIAAGRYRDPGGTGPDRASQPMRSTAEKK